MEIEKTLKLAASPQRVWALLLDPQVMGGCVPGMKSIEVVSDVEYVAVMHVKIAFINAKFRLRTTIVEQRAPDYLRAEGTGEDASVASSLKQQSEIFLAPTPDGGTELRIKVTVDVLGRLGTFGLSVMKTKADRMWDEFGANLVARIDGTATDGPGTVQVARAPDARVAAAPPLAPKPSVTAAAPVPARAEPAAAPVHPLRAPAGEVEAPAAAPGWWSRLTGGGGTRSAGTAVTGRCIRVEVRKLDQTVTVEWPVEDAQRCQQWLREIMG